VAVLGLPVWGGGSVAWPQWRRQHSKGARSFRGQNILEPDHLDAPFSEKSSFLVVALKTQRPPMLLRLFHCQNKTNKAVSGQYGSFR